MSITFTHDDKQILIAYVYGEVDSPVRTAVEAHLAECAECAAEVTALGGVRSELSLWVPPEVDLDFTIVKKSELPTSNVLRPARWWNTAPVWAQAAAAIFVLAVGAAIANVQVRSGPDGLVVSTGWMPFDSNTTNAARGVLAQDKQANDDWKVALSALEQQLRTEIRANRDLQAVRVGATAAAPDEATVRRVRQLIAESELRQDRELALRFTQLTRDMTMQRRADMQRISAGFGEYDNRLMRQGQMINNVIRVSGTPQQ